MPTYNILKYRDDHDEIQKCWERARRNLASKENRRVENDDLLRHYLSLDPELVGDVVLVRRPGAPKMPRRMA